MTSGCVNGLGSPGEGIESISNNHWLGKGMVRRAIQELKSCRPQVISELACGKCEDKPFLFIGADGSFKIKINGMRQGRSWPDKTVKLRNLGSFL